MSVGFTYPGVYIQELPSAVHTITGAATSITAFVGYTPRGIDNRAQAIFSFADFQRLYGGLASNSELSYAVQQFYLNAPGSQAYVVRTPMAGATPASVTFDGLTFTALSSGTWANGQLLVDVDTQNLDLTADPLAFNLTITDLPDQVTESFPAVTLNPAAQNYVATIVNDPDNGSQLVSVSVAGTPGAPAVTGLVGGAFAISGATSLDEAVGGAATGTVATQGFGITIATSSPASALAPQQVTVFNANTPIPQSMSGLAAQLQLAINAKLAVAAPGSSVQVSVAQVAGGQALRLNALLPLQPDAVLSISAPAASSGLSDAAQPLGFEAPALANVSHYALGTGQDYASSIAGGQAAASAPALPGTGLPGSLQLIGDPASFTGIYALQKVSQFNLLSIPDATRALPSNPAALDPAVDPADIYANAIALCDQRRAFLLVDPPPNVTTMAGAIDWKSSVLGITDPNGAAFWPRLRLPDQLSNFNLRTFAPSGVVAGVYAATDGTSGVWKAPAGTLATLNGVQSLTYQLSDSENGLLNPLGLNCFRTFPVYGRVLWGARTLAGADALASQWKYVPVRRMALFLEQSLYQGLQWAVFEPNDEPLWAAIRLNVGSFMQTYFQKQAFQGQTPDQAYFVKCDSETTTQTDINNGIVNVLVGFAPLQPAEFVLIQIEQLTGQAQA
jgi:phage tail sheath protein FI